jgi:WD40 repeat protein
VALDVAFNADGTRLVTADADGTARVWRWPDPRELVVLRGHTGPVTSAGFSHDGTKIVTSGADGTVRVWNARTGVLLTELDEEGDRVNSAAFGAEDRTVLSASVGMAGIWSAELDEPLGLLEQIASRRVAGS